ncbi:MAG TPA: type II 3-dehydroquinate dehydratase, partial [Bacillota bacterium]|nr:type II 3-dehydroquinate dehydratase [Bacillota bacterium]
MRKVLVINGPNLNLLGIREPGIYGNVSLETINTEMLSVAKEHQLTLEFFQSNHEGSIVDKIHEAMGSVMAIILNAGAYTHYSIAIRDAISATNIPTVEVHMSNVHARVEFRHTSVLAPVAV